MTHCSDISLSLIALIHGRGVDINPGTDCNRRLTQSLENASWFFSLLINIYTYKGDQITSISQLLKGHAGNEIMLLRCCGTLAECFSGRFY